MNRNTDYDNILGIHRNRGSVTEETKGLVHSMSPQIPQSASTLFNRGSSAPGPRDNPLLEGKLYPLDIAQG